MISKVYSTENFRPDPSGPSGENHKTSVANSLGHSRPTISFGGGFKFLLCLMFTLPYVVKTFLLGEIIRFPSHSLIPKN